MKNVYGGKLQSCSLDGMAKTGYLRDGMCAVDGSDIGNHHICIDISSVDKTKGNFCKQTDQTNWCSKEMLCNNGKGKCPVKNWCICQWAFADYIKNAGGCDKINDIHCDSTNMEALVAYQNNSSDPKIASALNCLRKKCNL